MFEQNFIHNDEFKELSAIGGRMQRPLWASTGTKNPKYSDTMYIDELIGSHTVNTLPPKTIEAVLDHGGTQATIHQNYGDAKKIISDIEAVGIKMKDVTDQLTRDGVELFAQSFDDLLTNLSEKSEQVRATG